MERIGLAVLIGAVIAASGCGREEAGLEDPELTGSEELATAADTSEAFEDSGAVPVVPVQGAEEPTAYRGAGAPITATGNLRGPGDSAPRGSVTLTEASGGTAVLVDIRRYTAGTRLSATLARGTCSGRSSPIAEIGGPVAVGGAGLATIEGSIAASITRVLDGGHSVHVHDPSNPPPATPLACADLPRLER